MLSVETSVTVTIAIEARSIAPPETTNAHERGRKRKPMKPSTIARTSNAPASAPAWTTDVPSNAWGLCGSQNTSIQRACGAQAASIGPVTRST